MRIRISCSPLSIGLTSNPEKSLSAQIPRGGDTADFARRSIDEDEAEPRLARILGSYWIKSHQLPVGNDTASGFCQTQLPRLVRRSRERRYRTRKDRTVSSNKKSKLLDVFEIFWDHVRRAEEIIRQYGHLGRLPPMCHGDPWDEDFAKAYDGIRRYLRKFQRDQSFRVPADLAFRVGPLRAETAHQALMFFLNKPEELHGEPGVLDSTEYLAIKSDAMREYSERDKSRAVWSTPTRSRGEEDARIDQDVEDLKYALRERYFPARGEGVQHPESFKDLRRILFPAWSGSKFCRRMQKLLKCRNAKRAFDELFRGGGPHTGFLRLLEDGTHEVEAISRESDEGSD